MNDIDKVNMKEAWEKSGFGKPSDHYMQGFNDGMLYEYNSTDFRYYESFHAIICNLLKEYFANFDPIFDSDMVNLYEKLKSYGVFKENVLD